MSSIVHHLVYLILMYLTYSYFNTLTFSPHGQPNTIYSTSSLLMHSIMSPTFELMTFCALGNCLHYLCHDPALILIHPLTQEDWKNYQVSVVHQGQGLNLSNWTSTSSTQESMRFSTFCITSDKVPILYGSEVKNQYVSTSKCNRG